MEMPKQTPAKFNSSPIRKAKSSKMKIKTVIFFCALGDAQPPNTREKHCEIREKHQNSTKTSHDRGGKRLKIRKRSGDDDNKWALEKKLPRKEKRKREKRRGKKYQERPQARREISQRMSPEQQHSASKDLNHCMQKTRKQFPPCRNTKTRKQEKEDKNMREKMSVENVLTERE